MMRLSSSSAQTVLPPLRSDLAFWANFINVIAMIMYLFLDYADDWFEQHRDFNNFGWIFVAVLFVIDAGFYIGSLYSDGMFYFYGEKHIG